MNIATFNIKTTVNQLPKMTVSQLSIILTYYYTSNNIDLLLY